jgi:hypothetical protein
VPRVVQPTLGDARAGDEQFPFPVICAQVERPAGRGGEHVAGVVPQFSGRGPFPVLFGSVSLEQRRQFVREANDPPPRPDLRMGPCLASPP